MTPASEDEIRQILAALQSPEAYERFGAAIVFGDPMRNLGVSRRPEFMAALVPLLGDPVFEVRHHASAALGTLGYKAAIPALRLALEAEVKRGGEVLKGLVKTMQASIEALEQSGA